MPYPGDSEESVVLILETWSNCFLNNYVHKTLSFLQ